MMGESEFSIADHLQAVKEERSNERKTRDDINEAKIEVIIHTFDKFDHCLLICSKQTRSWLTVQGTTVTGTVLLAMKFRDFCVNFIMLPP